MLSRMKDFWNVTFLDEKGRPKQGQEFRMLRDMYGFDEIGIILRWRNGRLHDDGDLPAVEFQDAHIEHYRNGLLHNDAVGPDGKVKPAIISEYGSQVEFYMNGMQIQ